MTNSEIVSWNPQMAALVKTKYGDVFHTIHEFQAFRYTCERAGLDPVVPEIWPVRYGGKNPRIVYQTSIEGYIKMAIRSGHYGGFLPPACVVRFRDATKGEDLFEVPMSLYDSKKHELIRAIARVINKEFPVPQEYFADLSFYKKTGDQFSNFWGPAGEPLMLYKCAQAVALRRTFPNETKGVYTQEEMHLADEKFTTTTTVEKPVRKALPPPMAPHVPEDIEPPPPLPPEPKSSPPPKPKSPPVISVQEEKWKKITDYLKKNGCSDEGIDWVWETVIAAYAVPAIWDIPEVEMETVKKYVWEELIPQLIENEMMPPILKKGK